MSWAHINTLEEYGFSEEKLRDTLGILPRKRPHKQHIKTGGSKTEKIASDQINVNISVVDLVPLLGRTQHGANAPEQSLFPTPITVVADGPVAVPPPNVQNAESATG